MTEGVSAGQRACQRSSANAPISISFNATCSYQIPSVIQLDTLIEWRTHRCGEFRTAKHSGRRTRRILCKVHLSESLRGETRRHTSCPEHPRVAIPPSLLSGSAETSAPASLAQLGFCSRARPAAAALDCLFWLSSPCECSRRRQSCRRPCIGVPLGHSLRAVRSAALRPAAPLFIMATRRAQRSVERALSRPVRGSHGMR